VNDNRVARHFLSQGLVHLLPALATTFLLTFGGLNCKKSLPVEPPGNQKDTTSHNFVWQTFTLGVGSSSTLNDVAIINDSLVYAVGEIYLNDSTGQIDPQLYNLAKLEGAMWELKRVTVDFRGNLATPPVEGIFAFSETDIWLAGSDPIHGDGQSWVDYDIRSISGFDSLDAMKCWGTSLRDMYFVGLSGSLFHYNGSSWTKIKSGTINQINDVWGVFNSSTNREEVYCAGLDPNLQQNTVLRITNPTMVERLPWDATIQVGSVWTKNGSPLYACGGKLYRNNSGVWREDTIEANGQFFAGAIRGIGDNDVFVVGLNSVAHYNGISWKVYPELSIGADYYRIAMTQSMVVIVGWSETGAVAIIGRR